MLRTQILLSNAILWLLATALLDGVMIYVAGLSPTEGAVATAIALPLLAPKLRPL